MHASQSIFLSTHAYMYIDLFAVSLSSDLSTWLYHVTNSCKCNSAKQLLWLTFHSIIANPLIVPRDLAGTVQGGGGAVPLTN